MIYTVAHAQETEKKLTERAAEGKRVLKDGISSHSRGGIVWQTLGEAQLWLAGKVQEYAEGTGERAELNSLQIYGVEADWERDTYQYKDEPHRRLFIARPVCRLDDVGNAA